MDPEAEPKGSSEMSQIRPISRLRSVSRIAVVG
jgi:hypothetical protein